MRYTSQDIYLLVNTVKNLKKEKKRFKDIEDTKSISLKEAPDFFIQHKYIKFKYKQAKKELLRYLLSN